MNASEQKRTLDAALAGAGFTSGQADMKAAGSLGGRNRATEESESLIGVDDSPVRAAVKRLSVALGCLHSDLAALEGRLMPYCTPTPAESGALLERDAAEEKEANKSPLRSDIGDEVYRAELARMRILRLLNRLE